MLLAIIVGALTVFAFNLLSLNVLWLNVGEDGNIANLTVILASKLIFNAFSSLIIGFIVDRFQKKKAITVSLFICAFLALTWLLADRFLFVAVIVYLAIDFASDIYADSFTALVAEKLNARNYIKLDALESITSSAVSIGSSLISAVLLILLSQEIVILIVASILIISAVICHKLLPESNVVWKDEEEDSGRQGLFKLRDAIESSWNFAKKNVFADKRIMLYTVILFVLNLDYAFIPTALPFLIMSLHESTSLILVVIMRSGNDIGEFVAFTIVAKYGHLVSRLTKIGLIGSALVFAVLPIVYTVPIAATVVFVLYGFFDTLTQPYYSYFVSSLDNDKRGRILGTVSFMVLLASPLGILLGNWLSSYGMLALSMGILSVFVFSVVVISVSKSFGNIKLAPDALDDEE
jgi:MFS family permease